jgi:hypothetical protein
MQTFRRTRPEDQGAIVQLMKSAFGADMPSGLISPALLQWKFSDPRSGSPEGCSYVIVGDGRIDAHVAEWPISFQTPAGEVRSCHLIDWVARPEAKGAGVSIYLQVMEQYETVLAIGGSEHARKLLPKMGFRPAGALTQFARVVRPWRQFRIRPTRAGWRDVARLGRNIRWKMQAPRGLPPGWTAAPASDLEKLPGGALRVLSATFCTGVRTASRLRWLTECPAMNCGLFILNKGQAARGYFLLFQRGGQCRIADLAVDSEARGDWLAAYRTAAFTAAEQPGTCEITAASSLPWLSDGLKSLGFQPRGDLPVAIYDPRRQLTGGPSLHLRMTDNDYCFLYSEAYPFLT